MSFVKTIFVTGTDTEIGKTMVSSVLIRSLVKKGLRVAGLKPIASGFEQKNDCWINEDIESLKASSNISLHSDLINVYAYREPIAPHIGAALNNDVISLDKISSRVSRAREKADVVLVEGVGGWRVPLTTVDALELDPVLARGDVSALAKKLESAVVLVVGMRLGCINHAVLTAEQILADGLPLLGWVANSAAPLMDCYEENLSSLQKLIPAPLLFELPFLPSKAKAQAYCVDLNASFFDV